MSETTKELEAGVELDALIAEKVMGWIKRTVAEWESAFPGRYDYLRKVSFQEDWKKQSQWFYKNRLGDMWIEDVIPSYSTDIAVAWKLIEHFHAEPHDRCVILNATEPGKWYCVIGASDGDEADHCVSSAPTAPLAICRASIKAIDPREG